VSTTLRFSTLNLQNFAAPPLASYEFDNIYSQAQWVQKTNWLRRVILACAPDVLMVQEVFSVDALKQLLLELGYGYFAVAGEPLLVDNHFYQQPVVALASRFPIRKQAALSADPALLQALGLVDFQFSRPPLWAEVVLPGIGVCDFYTVHLKSRRALTAVTDSGGSETLARFAASAQRGYEAALLLELIRNQRQQSGRPVVLAGDFNDALSSDWLRHLTVPAPQLQLQDAWLLWQEAPTLRPASHYYGATGSVLDYCLLSADFDHNNLSSLGSVTDIEITDSHLVRPDYQQDAYSSDHAMVTVTVQLRD
jgi:endonuclease/exonuclease/phosphatase family metal-dependent hydrolase